MTRIVGSSNQAMQQPPIYYLHSTGHVFRRALENAALLAHSCNMRDKSLPSCRLRSAAAALAVPAQRLQPRSTACALCEAMAPLIRAASASSRLMTEAQPRRIWTCRRLWPREKSATAPASAAAAVRTAVTRALRQRLSKTMRLLARAQATHACQQRSGRRSRDVRATASA